MYRKGLKQSNIIYLPYFHIYILLQIEPLMTTARPTLSKTTSASAEDELPQNELATKELNLLAQLIGADILANDRQSRDTFKINLFDQDKTNNLEKPK